MTKPKGLVMSSFNKKVPSNPVDQDQHMGMKGFLPLSLCAAQEMQCADQYHRLSQAGDPTCYSKKFY